MWAAGCSSSVYGDEEHGASRTRSRRDVSDSHLLSDDAKQAALACINQLLPTEVSFPLSAEIAALLGASELRLFEAPRALAFL